MQSARLAESLSLDADGRPRHRVRGLKSFLEKSKGGEYLQEVLRVHASLASKIDWVDEWPAAGPADPPKLAVDGEGSVVKPAADSLGELANTASALGTRDASSEERRVSKKRRCSFLSCLCVHLNLLLNKAKLTVPKTSTFLCRRRKKYRNPFVEALRESEGGKGTSKKVQCRRTLLQGFSPL